MCSPSISATCLNSKALIFPSDKRLCYLVFMVERVKNSIYLLASMNLSEPSGGQLQKLPKIETLRMFSIKLMKKIVH